MGGYRAQKAANSMRGAQNRAQGEIFEKIIDASCRHYREKGIAEIEKTPEPFKVTRRDTDYQFYGHFAKKAQPDYKGTLRGGKSIIFEAKHTDSDRIKYDRVSAEQLSALNRHKALGASCYILISLKMHTFAMVPLEVWQSMKQRYGRLYMTEKDIEQYKVRYSGYMVDFLQNVIQ